MSVRSGSATRCSIADMFLVRRCPTALLLLLLVVVVANCAAPAAVQKSPIPPSPTTSFDGQYRSTIQVTGMAAQATGTNWCDTTGLPVITVSGGQFSYTVPHPNVPGNPAPTFHASISQDGSFAAGANHGTISGQVRGTHMEGTIDGQGCIYGFTGDRM